MLTAKQIRQQFFDFFRQQGHEIVPSAPMVVKNDPTLMFTNAGMNQFKDIFLDNEPAKFSRVADAQKCLRVSGKHNDLEEVGHDTYHHTMFEMLGNWSFGDYFKNEAINWAWQLLTEVFKIDVDRLYATVFEGDKQDNVPADDEAKSIWQKHLPDSHILYGNKKDNFWEMGDIGPCGPCSEIHIDLRTDEQRQQSDGAELVNKDHPEVIEIWNLVFIQYQRKANGQLEVLPNKHIDTGMGFERLCRAIQGKKSNYDSDVFQPLIQKIAKISNIPYGQSNDTDIAMRVIADHLRAIAFSIADGQLPSNKEAGYVIRRILRRAVRYGFTFLNQNEPFMVDLLPTLNETMGEAYPELIRHDDAIRKVLLEEEVAFLRTLDNGIKRLDQLMAECKAKGSKVLNGHLAFELYDTYGFPLDLTELITRENDLTVDQKGFDAGMKAQKDRSRQATNLETGDWLVVHNDEPIDFVGYDQLETDARLLRYRQISIKKKTCYQLVLSPTPFYAESGGQVGDTGYIESNGQKIHITDTKKENNLLIHFADKLPENPKDTFRAVVNADKRQQTANNHSATHLLHHVLQQILGAHVEQRGSFVCADYLRFDFSHFQKLSNEELQSIEQAVNKLIRENNTLDEHRALSMEEAEKMGALAFFGEKYGDQVRVVRLGDSLELCGGTHVAATGQIGYFKITSESAVAAGIRRIEARTGIAAQNYIDERLQLLDMVKQQLKSNDVLKSLENLIAENSKLKKELEVAAQQKVESLKKELLESAENINDLNLIIKQIKIDSAASIKNLAFQLKDQIDNLILVLGTELKGKANLTVMISDELVNKKNYHAGQIIKQIAREIQGGGGGQAFYATAGGKNPAGIDNALNSARELILNA